MSVLGSVASTGIQGVAMTANIVEQGKAAAIQVEGQKAANFQAVTKISASLAKGLRDIPI